MKEKTKKRIDTIVKIILIIVIIILLIHNCVLNQRGSIAKVPTGNVDIIEIKCDKDDTCEVSPIDDNGHEGNGKTPNKEASQDDSNQNAAPVNKDEDIIDQEGMVTVYDKDVTWHGVTQARIFTNSMYKIEDVIAPESSNTYQFIVKNSANFRIKYDISFIETNIYNINMKFKLKKNDTYLIDHYVSASELNQTNFILDTSNNDTYYLEWKWVSSENDTEVGKTPNANYGLNIEVKAESTND